MQTVDTWCRTKPLSRCPVVHYVRPNAFPVSFSRGMGGLSRGGAVVCVVRRLRWAARWIFMRHSVECNGVTLVACNDGRWRLMKSRSIGVDMRSTGVVGPIRPFVGSERQNIRTGSVAMATARRGWSAGRYICCVEIEADARRIETKWRMPTTLFAQHGPTQRRKAGPFRKNSL